MYVYVSVSVSTCASNSRTVHPYQRSCSRFEIYFFKVIFRKVVLRNVEDISADDKIQHFVAAFLLAVCLFPSSCTPIASNSAWDGSPRNNFFPINSGTVLFSFIALFL